MGIQNVINREINVEQTGDGEYRIISTLDKKVNCCSRIDYLHMQQQSGVTEGIICLILSAIFVH